MTVDVNIRAHGEIDCADAETLLQGALLDLADARARLALYESVGGAAGEETDRLRAIVGDLEFENARLRHLLEDHVRKSTKVAEERDDYRTQVKYLAEELAATEAGQVPDGTWAFAPIAEAEVMAAYRRISRITRGPLPPAIRTALEEGKEVILAAMAQTGSEEVTVLLRREVRRRRRARSTRSTRGRSTSAQSRSQTRARPGSASSDQ